MSLLPHEFHPWPPLRRKTKDLATTASLRKWHSAPRIICSKPGFICSFIRAIPNNSTRAALEKLWMKTFTHPISTFKVDYSHLSFFPVPGGKARSLSWEPNLLPLCRKQFFHHDFETVIFPGNRKSTSHLNTTCNREKEKNSFTSSWMILN